MALASNSEDIIEYGLVNSTAKKKIQGLNRKKHTLFLLRISFKHIWGAAGMQNLFGAHKIHSKIIVTDPWSNNPQILIGVC